MDLAKSGIIWKAFNKGRGAEIFSLICSTILWEHFTGSAPTPSVVCNSEPNCQLRTQLYLHSFLHPTIIAAMGLKYNLENISNGAVKTLGPGWCYFSICNIAKNARFCRKVCEEAFSAVATSNNTASFLYPNGAVVRNFTRWRCNFKGLLHDGEQADFFKPLRLTLRKAFRLIPLSARSISQDSKSKYTRSFI